MEEVLWRAVYNNAEREGIKVFGLSKDIVRTYISEWKIYEDDLKMDHGSYSG